MSAVVSELRGWLADKLVGWGFRLDPSRFFDINAVERDDGLTAEERDAVSYEEPIFESRRPRQKAH